MTPKSLLRHEQSVSSLEDLANGEFATVIDEVDVQNVKPAGVRRVVMCSGKVYFDLLKARRAAEGHNNDVALVRVEQLYPFPVTDPEAVIAKYPNAREIVWCQEEPQNQGAWYQIRHRCSRSSASATCCTPAVRRPRRPATGITKLHELEQRSLIEAALTATHKEDAARETKRLMAGGNVPASDGSCHVAIRNSHGHRNQGSAITRVGRRRHARHLAQAGRADGRPRRESRRPRNRQGGARGSSAGQRRAQGTQDRGRHLRDQRPGAGRAGRGSRCHIGTRGREAVHAGARSSSRYAGQGRRDAVQATTSWRRRCVAWSRRSSSIRPRSRRRARMAVSPRVTSSSIWISRPPRRPVATSPQPQPLPPQARIRSGRRRRRSPGSARADDAAARAHRRTPARSAADAGAAHHVQRDRPQGGHGRARASTRTPSRRNTA